MVAEEPVTAMTASSKNVFVHYQGSAMIKGIRDLPITYFLWMSADDIFSLAQIRHVHKSVYLNMSKPQL